MISVDEQDTPFIKEMFDNITRFVEKSYISPENREKIYELMFFISAHLMSMYGRASSFPLYKAQNVLESVWTDQLKHASIKSRAN